MMIDLVKYPVLTEKSARLIENNQYTFDVDLRLNKLQIKKLIEELFQVTVIAVNTHRPPRKKKRLGVSQGFKTSYKRAIITIKPGQSIMLFPEN
jgi:large subunit ribosomal protein L23